MKKEIRKSIKKVYGELWDILALYETTNCYNEVPQESEEKDILKYLEKRLLQVRRKADMLFLGQPEIRSRLMNIVDETEHFVMRCERPGVVKRWLQMNERMLYFDCAFDLMEEAPECYKQISRGLTDVGLCCYPDAELIEARKKYFAVVRGKCEDSNLKYSEDRIFQDELLRTLTLAFENDFKGYLKLRTK